MIKFDTEDIPRRDSEEKKKLIKEMKLRNEGSKEEREKLKECGIMFHPTVKMLLIREATCKDTPFARNRLGLPEGTKITCDKCDHTPFLIPKALVSHLVLKHRMSEDAANNHTHTIVMTKLQRLNIRQPTQLDEKMKLDEERKAEIEFKTISQIAIETIRNVFNTGTHIFIDFETTGFDFPVRVTQVAAVLITNQICTSFHSFVQPERPINPAAQRLSGISLEKLQKLGAQSWQVVGESFRSFLQPYEGTLLIFHSYGSYDNKVLEYMRTKRKERKKEIEINMIGFLR